MLELPKYYKISVYSLQVGYRQVDPLVVISPELPDAVGVVIVVVGIVRAGEGARAGQVAAAARS